MMSASASRSAVVWVHGRGETIEALTPSTELKWGDVWGGVDLNFER